MAYQSAIDALLAQARAVLDRVELGRLDDELAAGVVLIDIRPVEQRQRDGELTGAIIIDRNILEWRLDPTSLALVRGFRAGGADLDPAARDIGEAASGHLGSTGVMDANNQHGRLVRHQGLLDPRRC
jgi:hypothetical protein